jgi:hypothetical protein
MIAEIEFEYGKKFSPAEQAELQNIADHPIKLENAEDEKLPNHKKLDWGDRTLILPIEDALRFGDITLKRLIGTGVCAQLDKVVGHLKDLQLKTAFNDKVQVVVP